MLTPASDILFFRCTTGCINRVLKDHGFSRAMMVAKRKNLQAAEKLHRRNGLDQGTTLVVPQEPQNQPRALAPAIFVPPNVASSKAHFASREALCWKVRIDATMSIVPFHRCNLQRILAVQSPLQMHQRRGLPWKARSNRHLSIAYVEPLRRSQQFQLPRGLELRVLFRRRRLR